MGNILISLVLTLMLWNLSIAQEVTDQIQEKTDQTQEVTDPLVAVAKKWEAENLRWHERRNRWTVYLGRRDFDFPKDKYGLISSMKHFSSSTCQLHVVLTPSPNRRKFIQIFREGKALLTLPGSYNSVFRTVDEKLYSVHFYPAKTGPTIAAYDLITGKILWEKDDIGRMGGGASGHAHFVYLGLSQLNQVQDEPEGAAIIITGNETAGHYIAVLDRETGRILAYRVYGKKFWKPEVPPSVKRSRGAF